MDALQVSFGIVAATLAGGLLATGLVVVMLLVVRTAK